MIVNFIIILVIIIFILILNTISNAELRNQRERQFLLCVCLLLVLIAGLRGENVGADTKYYLLDYSIISSLSISSVIEHYSSSGTGFYVLAKIFSLSGLSVHCFFGAVELLYCYAIYKFLMRFSDDKLFGIMCFCTMGLFGFSMAGLKQTVAMAFSLLALMLFMDKKYFWSIVLLILSIWCHRVSLISVVIIILYLIRGRIYYYPILFIFFLSVLVIGDTLWGQMIMQTGEEHYIDLYYEENEGIAYTQFLFYSLLIVILSLSFKTYNARYNEECQLVYSGAIFSVAFYYLATSFSVAFRVGYFFAPLFILLVTNGTSPRIRRDPSLKRMLMFLMIFFYLYSGRGFVYRFFWQ